MLLTKKSFKFQKKYAYNGDDKYPHYILIGKKISKEQAEKIIITETGKQIFKYGNNRLDYDESNNDSIKKPLSIQETIDAEEREKEMKEIVEDDNFEDDNNNMNGIDNWFYNTQQEFISNTPLPFFIDALGNVGANDNTTKYPNGFEFIVEHLEYANRYPFLSYVIIYMNDNYFEYNNRWVNFLFPPVFDNLEQKFEAFTYALYVHDGGLEVVKKDEAIRLYKKYQKQYPNDLIFNRRDYNEYVKDNFVSYNVPFILKNWVIDKNLKKEIKKAYKEKSTIPNINMWFKNKNDYHKNKYLEYKKMSKELENILCGKKTNLNISQDLYDKLKEYIENVYNYHERMNKVKDMEKYLSTVLSRNDFRAIRDVIYDFKYNRKSIELRYKNDKKDIKYSCSLSLLESMYKSKFRMYDELEHIRNGEKTKLKYNKKILKKLKEYIDYVIAEDGNEIERKELEKIWSMEREVQLKLDKKTYQTIADTILFTRSNEFDMEKEYRILNCGKELAISFMKEVKNAVKKKDFALKSIDEKAYIKKYNKLHKEYKTLIDTCLEYY